MKTFQERKAHASRVALDMLPEEHRPALTPVHPRPHACGECQACCEVQRIVELNKPAFKLCSHQCSEGCDIYHAKPAECTVYQCAWTSGVIPGDTSMRPDKLGLVVDFRPALDREGKPWPEGEDLITVWEAWHGAALSDRGWSYILKLMEHRQNTCLVPWGAPQLDANRIAFVRLFSTLRSVAADGVFNLRGPDHKKVLRDAIHHLLK